MECSVCSIACFRYSLLALLEDLHAPSVRGLLLYILLELSQLDVSHHDMNYHIHEFDFPIPILEKLTFFALGTAES
jgi:hypothetical protein